MIFAGDVIIKTAIELGLEDLRKNSWVVEDIFSEFIENPLLVQKYGMKEIQAAKDFLLNNKINIFMAHRLDSEAFPCVTIALGESVEDKALSTLGDQSIDVEEYSPDEIGKPIPWIIKPFEPVSYDSETGEMKIPKDDAFKYISEGMLLVNSENGNAWTIRGKKTGNKILLDAGTEIDGNLFGIAPRYRGYRARRERIISQENYSIGCHVNGNPSNLLFLFAFVKYSLLRYREGLLEHNNFQLSNLSCTDMIKNQAFETTNVYSRFIQLSGQAEESWIKTPYRHIEAIDSYDQSNQTIGIKIISNENTGDGDESENDLWVTVSDEES